MAEGIRRSYCFCRGPEFISCMFLHDCLWFQLQGTWCPCLASETNKHSFSTHIHMQKMFLYIIKKLWINIWIGVYFSICIINVRNQNCIVHIKSKIVLIHEFNYYHVYISKDVTIIVSNKYSNKYTVPRKFLKM